MDREQSIKTQQARLEAYGRVRPIVEKLKNEPHMLEMFVDVAWEFMVERREFLEIAYLLQNGLNHLTLTLQQLTEVPPGPEAYEGQRLVVAWSNVKQTRPCGVCGRPDHTDEIGPMLFVEGSSETACPKCGEKHAPELAELLNLLYKNKKFVSALEDLRRERLRKSTQDF